MRIETPPDDLVAFAGSRLDVEVTLRNAGPDLFKGELRQRLWQRSTTTMQPIGEAAAIWSGELAPNAQQKLKITTDIPKTRTAARFILRIMGPSNGEIAAIPLIGVPAGWFASEISAIPNGLAVWDPGNLLCPDLDELVVKHKRITALHQAPDEEWGILVLFVRSSDPAEAHSTAERLRASGKPVLLFGETAADSKKEDQRLPLANPSEIPDLATNPQSQLRFLALLREALRSKTLRTAHPKTPNN